MAAAAGTDGRRERSRHTRARIVAAASLRFVSDGYHAATIEAIAQAAGVVVQTVYNTFGSKPKLLAAVLEHSIVGDLDPVPVAARPWVEALGELDDAAAALALLVGESVDILGRVAPIHRVIRSAAADPEVAALHTVTRQRRREDQQRLVGLLADGGHLRPGLDVAAAADVYYAIVNEEVFDLLTGDCGWDVARFRTWATELLEQQLGTAIAE
jgi:AcrR family transcriptional regulator